MPRAGARRRGSGAGSELSPGTQRSLCQGLLRSAAAGLVLSGRQMHSRLLGCHDPVWQWEMGLAHPPSVALCLGLEAPRAAQGHRSLNSRLFLLCPVTNSSFSGGFERALKSTWSELENSAPSTINPLWIYQVPREYSALPSLVVQQAT